MAFLGALFFGFVPMFLYAAFINWLDRYEKEPKLLLGAAFVWGMVIAAWGIHPEHGLRNRHLCINRLGGRSRIWNDLHCRTDY